MPEQAEGASGDGASSGDNSSEKKTEEGNKHKKLLRLLTVFAYLSTVSGTAFMLSLYYLFLWTPKVQLGGKALIQDPPPPGTLALFYPEMAPQLAARVAEEEKGQALAAEWAARAEGSGLPDRKRRAGASEVSESQVPATPQLVLPSIKEPVEAFGKRREARSTLMEMTTTQQTPPSPTTNWGTEGGRGLARAAQTPHPQPPPASTPPHLPPTHRTKNKGGGEQASWHSTPHPHPAEIAVHA